jgi:hypothetical protein
MRNKHTIRAGFSSLEAAIGLGILGVALVLATQLIAWELGERSRNRAHQRAVEAAANALEAARACPWDKLDTAWAQAQSSATADADWKLAIKVEEKALEQPTLKRVTVQVEGPKFPPVQMVGLFGAREVPRNGGKP